jgi:pyridoxal phosphate enzyme (YggS family)
VTDVAARLAQVRDRISKTGRNPDDITIVAVTKGFDVSVCRLALEAGLRNLGENRVQEAMKKMEEIHQADWHLIGHLQTNKVKLAAGRFTMIQSVDSSRLAEAIARHDPSQAVLVEVNIPREARKSGADPAQALEVIGETGKLLDLRGLMAMGPAHGDPRPAFDELRELRDEAEQRLGRSLPVLSMGMSGDFEAAVAAGSTMVRLGEVLFGPRPISAVARPT